jgi:CheY-like chemotaxis protein
LRHNKNRVLLIDDEPDVVYLTKKGLERIGFEVDVYTDPLLALQNYKSGIYRLLLFDIKMPKMNGIELFNKIDKEDGNGNVKICFFSASEHLISKYKDTLQNPDRFLFILKPISIPEMTRQIMEFLNKS